MSTQPDTLSESQELIYRWAYRFLRNHHDALDATQEVLVKSLAVPSAQVDHPKAWLRRITTNHCIDVVRRRRPSEQCPCEPVSDHSPAERTDQEELRDDISLGLLALSDLQRSVVVAKVYDQETFASIAQSLGISTSTAKTHYIRGLRILRESLKHHRGATS